MSKTLGFIGSGDVGERKVRALLNDALDAHDKVKVVLPVTKATWHPRLETVAAWALKQEAPILAITDDSTDALTRSRTIDKALVKDVLGAAVKTEKVVKVTNKLVNLLAADDGDLWVFWDDKDEDAYAAFEKAWSEEVPTYDACSGLDQMRFPDDEENEEERKDDDDEEERKDDGPEDEDVDKVPDDAEDEDPFPSMDELEEMTLEQVQMWAKKLDPPIVLPQRTRQSTYLKAIRERLEGDGTTERVPDDDDVKAPENEDVDDVSDERTPPAGVDATTGEILGRDVPAWPVDPILVVGSCAGCGGPWIFDRSDSSIEDHHAEKCPLA